MSRRAAPYHRQMRTSRLIAKKAGPRLCSQSAICYYLTVLIFVYIIATLYTATSSHRAHITSLEKEIAQLRAGGSSRAAPVAKADDSPVVQELKKKLHDQEEQLKRVQASHAAVQAHFAAEQVQQQQALGPPSPSIQPQGHLQERSADNAAKAEVKQSDAMAPSAPSAPAAPSSADVVGLVM